MIAFRHTRRWATTAFAAPFLVHRGVRVYHILHREGWPLDYHFSWQQTRDDGDRTLPGESFDIRDLPDFYERPSLSSMPEGATAREWRAQHFDDRVEQLKWFIDESLGCGLAPWTGFNRPIVPWRTLCEALADDISQLWRHWFPSAEERNWRKYDTYPGSTVGITLMTNGTTHFRMLGASHWKRSVDRVYPNTMAPAAMARDYEKYLTKLFREHLPKGRPLIIGAHAVINGCMKMDDAEFATWCAPFRSIFGMSHSIIVRGEPNAVFSDDHVLLVGHDNNGLREARQGVAYIIGDDTAAASR